MTKFLSNAELERYRTDGCLFPLTVMAEADAVSHRRRLEIAEAARGPMHYMVKPYLVFRSAWEIGTHPRLLDAVEDVLGPDILLWDAAYVIKEPHSEGYVSWHQDLTYWGLESDEVVTAWMALSSSTSENGCMKFLPGTHRSGKRAHEDTYAADNLLHRGQQVSEPLDEAASVDIVLAPGQASLHHGWLLHASNPNPSARRRIGLTLQYITPRVRQLQTGHESATLVRGRDMLGHFQPEPICQEDFAPAAIAFQQEVERLKHAVYDAG